MPTNRKLDYVILDLIETSQRTIRTAPLNLGGVPGSGGGEGAPPGGFIGYLPQTRVTYDTDEFGTLATTGSGTLLDNLNHIRYRLGVLESGASIVVWDDNNALQYLDVDTIHFSGAGIVVTDLGSGDIRVDVSATGSGGAGTPLTVKELDGSPIVTNVDTIIFSGATVTDNGGGDVLITITGSGGGISDAPSDGSTYGRKDGAWIVVSGGGGQYRQYLYTANVRADHPISQSFNVEGKLAVASGVAGAYIVTVTSGILDSVYMYIQTPGTSGTTTVDVNLNGTTVFTNQADRLMIAYSSVTKKVESIPAVSGLVKGDIITFDIDTTASGAAWLTVAPVITPLIPYGFVTSAGEPVTVLLDLE